MRNNMVQVRLTSSEKKLIRKMSNELKCTESELVRKSIEVLNVMMRTRGSIDYMSKAYDFLMKELVI